MARMARVRVVAWVLVSVILIGGGAFAKIADNLRRIVKFRGIDMTEPEGLATARSVVNMSLGFSTDNPLLQQAIQSLFNSGVIMVAAAGNRCTQSPGQDEGGGDECHGGPALIGDPEQTAIKYPAAYPSVLAVVPTDIYYHLPAYSLSGPQVDVASPGGSQVTVIRILSTDTGGGYDYGSGTSQAAAYVTGAIAQALQLQPGLSFAQVRSVLQSTATDLGYPQTQRGPDGSMPRTWCKRSDRRDSRGGSSGGNVRW
jgi:subtilisin family serine protease